MLKDRKKKEKFGTILHKDVIIRIKQHAVREGRTISEVVEEAFKEYEKHSGDRNRFSIAAARRFSSRQFPVDIQSLRELLEEDYYE